MPKPDKVLRSRPLKELSRALEKLKLVCLFHPEPIVMLKPHKLCVCGKGERKQGQKCTVMTQCGDCLEWFHNDCANVPDAVGESDEHWRCEWCCSKVDQEGYQRWTTGRKKPKKRHLKDRPRVNGGQEGKDPPQKYSAPRDWDGKVEEIRELSRRQAIKKRKLAEAVQELVDEEGHHLVDAEGMNGLGLRNVDDGLVDEMVGAGFIHPEDFDEN